jgi:DNA processing protein
MRNAIRLVHPQDGEWPAAQLAALEGTARRYGAALLPPAELWVRGGTSVAEVVTRAVAIVGAVDATPYGTRVAWELASRLARAGWTVVSGGGYGIAGAAHRGAMAGGGATVAVIGGGLRRPYPTGHATLFEQIAEHGLLLSECPPGVPVRPEHVSGRNRLTAALTAGTVVVEATGLPRPESVAARARQLGRVVMAVPGPVTSAHSLGCHLLAQQTHVRLVTSALDVLDALTDNTREEMV